MDADERLRGEVARHPYPLVFATISGAHLYGFPSPDSDYDLRGCHVLPVREVVGLDVGPGDGRVLDGATTGCEIDLVTHDARKFFGLLLKKNGYVLEQLLLAAGGPHDAGARGAEGDRPGLHHAAPQPTTTSASPRRSGGCSRRSGPRRVKPLLYVYRVLLTGIHLMRTGEVEANLVRLNEEARLPHVDDLIARKLAGPGAVGPGRRRRGVPPAGVRAAAGRTGGGPPGQHAARGADRPAGPE